MNANTHYRPTFNGQKGTIEVKTSKNTIEELDKSVMEKIRP